MSSVSSMTSGMGGPSAHGGPGGAKSIIEGTLAKNAEWQAKAQAPLKVPDAREMFAIGKEINIVA
ncbi:MAG TPA: hypothetical protein PLN69_12070 [bacterium]|nr:hypothetical protein [bacterium]